MKNLFIFVAVLAIIFSPKITSTPSEEADALFLKLRDLQYVGEGPVVYDSTSSFPELLITVLYNDTATVESVDAVCYYGSYTKYIRCVYIRGKDAMRVWHRVTGRVLALPRETNFPYFHPPPKESEDGINSPEERIRMADQEDGSLFAHWYVPVALGDRFLFSEEYLWVSHPNILENINEFLVAGGDAVE